MMQIPEPEAAIERFAAAWNSRDAAALAALFDDDADFVNVVGIRWRGGQGWSIAAAQNTDILPGAETMAASDGGLSGAEYGGGRDAHR